jgi:hypothetical protein
VAWYPQAVRKNIPPGPNDPPIKPRLAILHVAATEADSLYGWFNGPSGGIESHFYVKYDGSVEQYRDTAYQADANVMANDFAVSIETQGLANGTWTDAQLATIKALLTWLHTTHGIPLVVPATWDGSGVGYHVLFEAQWDQRGASCPGPNRITQFKNVLVPWMAAGGNGDDMSAQDVKAVNDYTAALVVYGYDSNGKRQPSLAQQINTLSAQVAALSTAVTALANAKGADAAAITKAVVDKVASLQLTLTPKE